MTTRVTEGARRKSCLPRLSYTNACTPLTKSEEKEHWRERLLVVYTHRWPDWPNWTTFKGGPEYSDRTELACVASVSARVRRERRDESKKKKRNDGGGGGERRNREISRSVFQNRGVCGQAFPLLPSPSIFHLFVFRFRSNFRAIIRLETLATQAKTEPTSPLPLILWDLNLPGTISGTKLSLVIRTLGNQWIHTWYIV